MNRVFLALDRFGRTLEPLVPGWVRRRAIAEAERWIIERLNGTHGLGAIFPAMVNAHEVLAILGYPTDHPHRVDTKEALRRLLVVNRDDAYCQPCVSPIWDTALACLAVREASEDRNDEDTLPALDWLRERQLRDEPGDWRDKRPNLRGGGWPFQLVNGFAITQLFGEQWRVIEASICVQWSQNGGSFSFQRSACRSSVAW